MRLIDADELPVKTDWHKQYVLYTAIENAPTIDAVPKVIISAYLQRKLVEWYNLGDRRFEPENVWGYNFIRACMDDLERKGDNFL